MNSGDGGGAGTSAAGEGLARTALPDPKFGVMPIKDLQESGVDTLRKLRMALDLGAFDRDRCLVDIGDELHRMWISHRHHDYFARPPLTQRQVPKQGLALGSSAESSRVEWDLVGLQPGRAHINPDPAIGFEAWGDQATQGLDAQGGGIRQALIMNKSGEATGTIATLLDLPAIGIEDPIAKIGIGSGRGLNDQDLIATNPEAAVSEPAAEGGRRFKRLAQPVNDDKVIASTVHF